MKWPDVEKYPDIRNFSFRPISYPSRQKCAALFKVIALITLVSMLQVSDE